jgi:hypothetical protein
MQWWEKTDRQEVLARTRQLDRNGGCIVLRGDDFSGTSQALGLALHALSADFGYQCFESTQVERPQNFDAAISLLWACLGHAEDPAWLGPWFLTHDPATAVEGIIPLLARLGRCAIALSGVDYTAALRVPDLLLLQRLVLESGVPVVVTSRTESHTDWSIFPEARVVELAPFTIDDVWECVLTRDDSLPDLPLDEVASDIQAMFAQNDVILPERAYAILRGWR